MKKSLWLFIFSLNVLSVNLQAGGDLDNEEFEYDLLGYEVPPVPVVAPAVDFVDDVIDVLVAPFANLNLGEDDDYVMEDV